MNITKGFIVRKHFECDQKIQFPEHKQKPMGQFKALSYKNWVLYKRGWIGALLELLIPLLLVAFVLLARKLLTVTEYPETQYFGNPALNQTYTISSSLPALAPYLKRCPAGETVALVPQGNSMISNLNTLLTAMNYTTRTYQSDSDVDAIVRSDNYGNSVAPKICFGVTVNSTGPNYIYKLRFNITGARSDGPSNLGSVTTDTALDLNTYVRMIGRGFIGTNSLMNSLILQQETGNSNDIIENKIGPIYQQYYVDDPVYVTLGNSIEILVMLPLLIVYLRQVSAMLSEKEKKIRETMSIMGMSTFLYYATWFLRFFFVYLVIHLIGSAFLVTAFPHISYGYFILTFILFDLVLIFQAFFIQIFFTRAKIGIVFALLFFVLQYVFSFAVSTSDNPSLRVNQVASIIPHIAFIFCFRTMIFADSVRISLSFTDQVNTYRMVIGFVLMFFNIVFWLLVTWYLDQVVPNEWGAKKHPCFCCCCGCIKEREQPQEEPIREVQEEFKQSRKVVPLQTADHKSIKIITGEMEEVDQKFREMEKNNQIIALRNLRKTFNDGTKVAVDNLNLNIYNDQIFVLLGHNGAGKTTTISLITGMLDQSAGSISVFGEKSVAERRKLMGICPQHDTLYDQLTVEEHLYLFGTFKGLQGQELDEQIEKLIKDVNLTEKRDEYSMNLSGGQKRRLSVAMAFAGRSKVIILDEPTSGMDTSARRYIWEMLKDYKSDRIIMLTTHFMDQADFLGDRIAIMGGGKLICCGSSIYLKNKFGVGYNITIVKKSNSASSQNIINVVKKHISDAKVLSDVSSELSMQLPLDKVKFFDALFNEIDLKQTQLEIQTYGISITTLEEVFLKVSQQFRGEQEEERDLVSRQRLRSRASTKKRDDGVLQIQPVEIQLKEQNNESYIQQPSAIKMNKSGISDEPFDENSLVKQQLCCGSFWRHLWATIVKRLRVIRRDLKSFLFELILPLIIIIVALLLMRVSFITDQPQKLYNVATLKNESSPMTFGIAASDATLLNSVEARLQTKYDNTTISIKKDSTSTTDLVFDAGYLKAQKTKYFRGGLFFNPNTALGSGTKYSYSSIINTRALSTGIILPTLAVQTLINEQLSSNISISMYNSPLPRTYAQLSINNTISGFFGAFVFSIALAFKFASIISFIVKERSDKSKHQQIVSGMNVASYWFGNFLYDLVLYLIVAAISIILIKVLNIKALIEGDALAATIIAFVLFGLSYIPLTYIGSYLFTDYGNAQAGWYFFTFILGGIVPIAAMVFRLIGTDTTIVGHIIAWICRIFPPFCFGESLLNMGSVVLYSIVETQGRTISIFDLTITLAATIYMAIFSVFYFVLVFAIESLQHNQRFMRFFSSETSILDTKQIDEDDVLAEQKKALEANPDNYTIITRNLRKVYNKLDSDTGYKVAVDNLSFSVAQGQVFGLLGINGAGKTTTFKMLAGQITSTSGDSYFMGLKISENLDRIRQNLGYCPQFDALIQNLTVREQIELYYDLKSLPSYCKEQAISAKIKEMDLEEYTDIMSGTLSGGNKRKLSVAMAMIGNPGIIFLDQPSTGMDPKARRFMWRVISRIAIEKKKSTIILTTHSMEEAEALSSRLGIMVGGNFKCIGTPQHIKSKYGQGFEIEVKLEPCRKEQIYQIIDSAKLQRNLQLNLQLEPQNLEKVLDILQTPANIRDQIRPNRDGSYLITGKRVSLFSIVEFILIEQKSIRLTEWMQKTIGQTEIIEHYQTFIRYKASKGPQKDLLPVGKIFGSLENNRKELGIQNYSIKQASVEQIFNRFAQEDGLKME